MLNALILGLVQGLSEFLPISSSGHVLFFETMFEIKDSPGFAAAIHLATALAAIIYFRKEIAKIFRAFGKFSQKSEDKDLGINIIIATIPATILGFIVSKIGLETYFSSLTAIGFSAIAFGLLLYFADKYSKGDKKITKWEALFIGASQIIAAIFPGASRSGVTLTTCFLYNSNKIEAAKFAFLISIPLTLLASLNEIILKRSVTLNLDFMIAFISAFISGLFAIKFLIYFIQKAQLKWLVIYRIIFGIIAIYIGLNY
jgi:undecaprenyl-diphosphatase